MNKTVPVTSRHHQLVLRTTFETQAVPPHERSDYWEDKLAHKVVGLNVSTLRARGLVARCSHFDLGSINIIDITGEEHIV